MFWIEWIAKGESLDDLAKLIEILASFSYSFHIASENGGFKNLAQVPSPQGLFELRQRSSLQMP